MSSKKFLSNKKTERVTIVLPSSLKERIVRYYNEQQGKNPHDKNFKSLSSTIHFLMENVMNFFKENKSLDDIKKIIGGNIIQFYDNLSFKALSLQYEDLIKLNKYMPFHFHDSPKLFINILSIFQENLPIKDKTKVFNFLNGFANSNLHKTIVEKININPLNTNSDQDFSFEIKIKGASPLLLFENMKLNASLLGYLGVKVVRFHQDMENLTCIMYVILTDLLFCKDISREKERQALTYHNLSQIIHFENIINEEDHRYFFQKLATDKNIIIVHKNYRVFEQILKKMENDLRKFGKYSKDKFLLSLLEFFQKLHWIEIESKMKLSFKFKLNPERFKRELNFLIDFLSHHSNVIESEGVFFLT